MNRSTWALILLTSVNYINYIDRYILASLLPYIQVEMSLNDVQLGLLTSAFMYPYLIIAPLFGVLGDRVRRNLLTGSGVVLWSVATVFTGMSPNYTALMASRMGLGVGEASFSVIAPAWLADFFDEKKRGRVMAIFSAALPVGAAIGYILGGVLGDSVGWRLAFMIVGGPGVALGILIFLLKDDSRRSKSEKPTFSPKIFYRLFYENGAFRHVVLGYCAYTFVVGGLANWMPVYLVRFFKDDMGDLPAGVVFGAVAALSGFLGTMIGGYVGDRWDAKSGNGYTKLSAISMWLAIPPFIVTALATDYVTFLVSLFLTMWLLFISTSPVNVMILNSVRLTWRSTAMAMAIFACHFLGDAISTPFIGFVSENYGGLKMGLLATTPVLFLSAGFWSWVVVRHLRTIPLLDSEYPKGTVQAHRGHHDKSQGLAENSLEAIHLAEKSYPISEIDVRLSQDGVVVLAHDDELTDGTAEGVRVSTSLARDLQEKHSLVTLKEVLQQTSEWINIEIKDQGGRNSATVAAVSELIKELEVADRVVVSSFHPAILRELSKVAPQVQRAQIVGKGQTLLRHFLFWGRPHYLHVEDGLFSDNELGRWCERGVRVSVWTVTDRDRSEKLLQLGVHSVIADVAEFKQ